MNNEILNKNLYGLLNIDKNSNLSIVRKSYYSLSKKYHPDVSKEENAELIFNEITEAYNTLMDSESRNIYDARSKWGANYDESTELLDYEFNNNAKTWDEVKFDSWTKNNQLNILIYIDDSFDGSIEYERYVVCKDCGGDGKDTKSKIEIKDAEGNILKLFDGADGCDFCDGTGIDWKKNPCYFCGGKGKVGYTPCKSCNGDKRILGKQKLSKIKFPKDKKAYKIEGSGHTSKEERGKIGCLWLIRN